MSHPIYNAIAPRATTPSIPAIAVALEPIAEEVLLGKLAPDVAEAAEAPLVVEVASVEEPLPELALPELALPELALPVEAVLAVAALTEEEMLLSSEDMAALAVLRTELTEEPRLEEPEMTPVELAADVEAASEPEVKYVAALPVGLAVARAMLVVGAPRVTSAVE